MKPIPNLSEIEASVVAEVEQLEGELVELASQMISTRSVNPYYPTTNFDSEVGGEGRCAKVVEAAIQDCGLEINRVVREAGRDNLVAVLEGNGDGRSLILNGHMDTVTAGDREAWQRDPWSGEVAEGSVWGRGAADMKGPVAAGAIALKALARHREALGGEVLLQCVVGEESSEGDKGTIAVIEDGYRADAAICMEPTGNRVGGTIELTLAPAAAGTLVLRFVIEGRSLHAARRYEVIHPVADERPGISAWEKGLLVTEALARLEQSWAFSKRSPYYDPGQFIVNPGVISSRSRGADSAFFVPDEFSAEYVIFYSPHDTRAEAVAEVLAAIDSVVSQDEWLSQHPPKIEWLPSIPGTMIEEDNPLFAAAKSAVTDLTGKVPGTQGLASGCDGGWLTEAEIPTLIYGPGDITSGHAPNESVRVDHMIQAAKVYALSALRYCR
jgi:acetylornithine deacetylase